MTVVEKEHAITQIEKVLYTAKAHTPCGRDRGVSRTKAAHGNVNVVTNLDRRRFLGTAAMTARHDRFCEGAGQPAS